VENKGRRSRSSERDAGFGLVSIVFSLLIVALLSVVALKGLVGETSTGTGSKPLAVTVDQARDVQAQSSLSSAMQDIRDGAISNGSVSASDLAQYGVQPSPSSSASEVSGAVADASAAGGDSGGALGFGGVTLAAQAASGTCWFVWFSASATWYGFEPDATTCVAQSMSVAPTAGPDSPGMIGWQQGSFPTTG